MQPVRDLYYSLFSRLRIHYQSLRDDSKEVSIALSPTLHRGLGFFMSLAS